MDALTISQVLSILILGILFTYKPFFINGDYFFLKHVPKDFTETTNGLVAWRKYRKTILLLMSSSIVFLILISQYINSPLLSYLCFSIFCLILPLVFSFAIKRTTKSLSSYEVEKDPTKKISLEVISNNCHIIALYMVPPILIIICCMILVFLGWDHIPNQLVTHWDTTGKPDGWKSKTVLNVLRPGILGLWVLFFSILAFLPKFRTSNGMKQIPLGFSLPFCYLISIFSCSMLLLRLPSSDASKDLYPIWLPILFLILIATVLLVSFRIPKLNDEDSHASNLNSMDANFWVAGFYKNPNDPVLFIEKPIGYGYTLNIGNKKALFAIVSFVLWLLGILVLYFFI